MELLSQLHPPSVHFAIALTITGIIFEVLFLIFRKESLKSAGFWTFMFGVVAVWGAMLTGHEAEEVVEDFITEGSKAYQLLETHEELGEILPYIFTVLGLFRLYLFFRENIKLHFIYTLAGVISIAAIGYQGNIGGKMVYEYGIGVQIDKQIKIQHIKEKDDDD